MKNIHVEPLRLAAKHWHRNRRSTNFVNGMVQIHAYDQAEREFTWWDDVLFIMNDYRVALKWVHPRMVYQDRIEAEAHALTAHLPSPNWREARTPIITKAGRSRKRLTGWSHAYPGRNEQGHAYEKERERLTREGDYQITPFLHAHWCPYAKCVQLCIPIEVRNEHDLRDLASLAKRLLKGETTLAVEFPGYCYTRSEWLKEGFAVGDCTK